MKKIIIPVNKAKLYCHAIEAGKPLIVIHGGPGLSVDYLLPQMEKLADDHLVIFYDQRGNGRSDGEINAQTMTLSQFTEDLLAIQNYFSYPSVALLGHSWGAYLAMHYATQYPDRVNHLILLNSIPIAEAPTESDQEDSYEVMIKNILAHAILQKDDKQGLIKFYTDLFQFFFYDPKLFSQLHLEDLTSKQVIKSARIHQLFEQTFFHKPHNLQKALEQCTIPTLIIHGKAHDLPQEVATTIHCCIKGSTLVFLESGHFPHLENTDALFTCMILP